jgi:uncharacterized OB-fold protein
MIRRCSSCNETHFLPRHLCPACWSNDLEWVEASGKGTVHSFTIIRRASMPEYNDLVPYVLAMIDLAEGPRMMTNIVGDDALETAVGDAVSVEFEERDGGAKIPQFRRSADSK